jgi:hypothetical protein
MVFSDWPFIFIVAVLFTVWHFLSDNDDDDNNSGTT